jgi:opacity protein-like surface antigen
MTEGGMKIVSLAAGTPLKEDRLSAGFGLNIYVGSAYDSSRSAVDINEYIALLSDTIDFRSVSDISDRRKFRGLNFNVGALYETGRYSFGLAVRTPFTLRTINDNRTANRVYERTPDTLLLISESSLLFNTDTKVDIPLQVALGMVFRAQENLLFAVDYEYKGFGNSKVYAQENELNPRSEFVEIDPQWKDVHQFRFGVEYQVATSWGTMPVRAGFRTEPLPYRHLTNVTDAIFDPTGSQRTFEYGDQEFGEVYTLGTGVQWSQVRLDLTYEYHTATRYQDGYFIDNLLKPDFISLQNNRSQRLSLGFTGFF